MPRKPLAIVLALGLFSLIGCREPLDFDRAYTADPARGSRLYKTNCANSCHPDNAFVQKSVTNFDQLAYTVRDYYEQVMGKDAEYSQQDVFDMSRYLNEKYYKFKNTH